MTLFLTLARTFHIGSAMLLVALFFFALFILPPVSGQRENGPAMDWFYPFFWSTLLVQALSGLAWFWVVAAQMSGEVPGWSDLVLVLGQTHFGKLWVVRAILGLGLTGTALAAWFRPDHRPHSSPGSGLFSRLALGWGLLLLGSLAWAGHAGSGRRLPRLHLGNDVLHLLVGAIWPMGLVPLLVWLLRDPATQSSVELAGKLAPLERFSRCSLVAVFFIVGSGVVNGWFMLASWSELGTTLYGQLLLAKVGVVGGMIGLGALHRTRSLPQLRVESQSGGRAGFYRTLGVETGLVIVVLGLVGIMGVTPPPH